MLVLALDTCLARCAVCLYDSVENHALAADHQDMKRGHAEALAPMVQRVFRAAHKHPGDVARVAVTTGPGTFTGVRIGLSFARAFGLARHIPVLGLDTLQAFRLSLRSDKLLALKSGQCGLAFVLREGSNEIALVPQHELPDESFLSHFPDLNLLPVWAALQPAPTAMPQPVYIRQADAKLPINISQVGVDRADTLSSLHTSAFNVGWSAADISAMLSITGTQAFIAEVAGNAAALVMTRTLAGQAEILTIATDPSRRRLGLSARLLVKAVEATKVLGAESIFLEVAASNIAARSLYAKAGFLETGRRKAYYANGDDAIVMARSLR